MKTFEFLVDTLPFGYAFNFDNYLFNKIKHINTQGVEDRADYFIINNVKKRIEGKIHFLLKDGVAFSPYKSLFGSFEYNSRIHPNLLSDFWSFIEQDLKSRHIEHVKIINFAGCYAPKKADVVFKTLEKSGFSIRMKAVNHHITVNENPLEHRMHPMEIRRLNKCKNSGFTFHQETLDTGGDIYDFLYLCRKEQNLQLSISRDKYLSYLLDFPQSYLVFSVRNSGELLAATLAIKVHKKILYSFLPGSLRKFKQHSPTVLLNEGLYTYCQNHQYEIFDLGISTEKNGNDQKSLIDFKERVGGEKSYKYFFEKKL